MKPPSRPAPRPDPKAKPAFGRKPPVEEEDMTESWWTARATSEVTKGFSRGEILAEPPPDPAVRGGLFDRLNDVLSQLSASAPNG
jgi:hypothetical protein